MVVVEKYPDLKTTDQFATFQSQMEGSENRIATERKTYTDFVQAYNKYRRQPVFPALMSSFFGFEARPYFEASQAAQSSPDINGRFKLNEETLNEVDK
jgi:LemA protein